MSQPSQNNAISRGQRAEIIAAEVLRNAGWEVAQAPQGDKHPAGDLLASRGNLEYLVEIKSASEGRADRLIPLWAQTYLEASHAAGKGRRALAVVVVPRVTPAVARQVLDFAERHAPHAGAGVMDFDGQSWFNGEGLADLGAGEAQRWNSAQFASREPARDLFSDLNQWLLKVLLAPEISEHLLSAPRQRYSQAAALAAKANVSTMSVSRFLRQLQQQGFLHRSGDVISLVRRADLFERWKAWSLVRKVRESPVRLIAPGAGKQRIHQLARDHHCVLGLFAGADALGVGFVSGVPPYLYVRQFDERAISKWKAIVPASPHESPSLIVRQAPSPESIFRGAVKAADTMVSDVIQVWLDVSAHPSRGAEQARKIYDQVMLPLLHMDQHG